MQIHSEHATLVGRLYRLIDEKKSAALTVRRSRLTERAKCDRQDELDMDGRRPSLCAPRTRRGCVKETPVMDTPDFSGEYRITCVADEAAADAGLTDKPCWRIDGPDGLVAFVWTWWRSERKILYEFFDGLGVRPGHIEPVVFAVTPLSTK